MAIKNCALYKNMLFCVAQILHVPTQYINIMVTSNNTVTLGLARFACPPAENAGNITFLRQGFKAKPPSLCAIICHAQFGALALA